MNEMIEFKTIAQVEAETESTESCRYYRVFEYARALAFTAFLRELESKHGENFRLVTAHPQLIINNNIKDKDEKESSKVFAIGLWARWDIGDVEYYAQMNENPFFDAYMTRTWKLSRTMKRHEYCVNMNDMIYAGADWNAEPENIELLTKNLRQAFAYTNKRIPDTYDKEIPAYDRKEKQTIYKGA